MKILGNSSNRWLINVLILLSLLAIMIMSRWIISELTMEKISFVSSRDGNWEIYLIRADGHDITRLTNQSSSDFDISWSPDGRRLAFVSVPENGGYEVHIMNLDNGSRTTLAGGRVQDWVPAWSPDGKWIAYASKRNQFDIYLIRPDGEDEVNLSNDPGVANYAPTWSPDSTRIAFTGNGIYLVDLDGSNLIKASIDNACNSSNVNPM